MTGGGRWTICFDDGGKRTIHESEIISLPILCSGLSVLISFSSGFCCPGVIKSHYMGVDENTDEEEEEPFYRVEREVGVDKNKIIDEISVHQIFLTPELAAILLRKQKRSPHTIFGGVDLNNIIPKKARVSKPQASNKEVPSSSSAEEDQVKTFPRKEKKTHWKQKQSTPEGPVTKIVPFSKKSSSMRNRKSISKTLPQTELEKLLGPLPKEGNRMFSGLGFLIIAKKNHEQMEGEMDPNAGRSTPFDPPYLIRQIECGAGTYFENLPEAQVRHLFAGQYLN